ncbi:MAG: RNA polymerase sigma factor [Flavobacteriaceae bacterium]|nr:RNA polymerase sigma factor [Flavobacteriaceae bacterium]
MEEGALIEKLQNKESQNQAFQFLVKTYQERLYWHIRKMVLNHNDTDDVLQNTFIKVHRNIGGFRGKSSLFSWMYRIATNEAITFLNQKAKRIGISNDSLQAHLVQNLQTDSYFDGDKAALLLQEAIATLPEKQRLVFQMKYMDDLKYQEIADILEQSVGSLKASYHHAVKKIEAYLTNR